METNNIVKKITYFIHNKVGDHQWEVTEYDDAPNEICVIYRDNEDHKYNQYNNMTKAEAVEIARAILKLAGAPTSSD